MATHVFRGIQRLTRVLDVGPLTFTLRRASTSAQKFVTGPNGEKILLSPFGEITYPEISISDFVWKDSEKYSNQIALVILIIYFDNLLNHYHITMVYLGTVASANLF